MKTTHQRGHHLQTYCWEATTSTSKETVNLSRPPLSESNTIYDLPPLPNGGFKHNDLTEKENNPEMAERLQIPKRTGRFSVCPKRILPPPAPRRSSLALMPFSHSHQLRR
ncbi:unnamed protein product [Thlaspi arvense]|uniref:Uncharacterized protein n=1 Tax=Thlaspi arvense TaxID=13288 RepID=A0AAU9S026_THLAR|nr:unnamed protein product [Thlaspi arvense]